MERALTDGHPEYDVFLSYSWRNKEEAVVLEAALSRAGLRVFRDEGMRVVAGCPDEDLRMEDRLIDWAEHTDEDVRQPR